MSDELKPLSNYLLALNKELGAGNATEHTHRPALKALLETLGDKNTAIDEPQRIKCGAPDLLWGSIFSPDKIV